MNMIWRADNILSIMLILSEFPANPTRWELSEEKH